MVAGSPPVYLPRSNSARINASSHPDSPTSPRRLPVFVGLAEKSVVTTPTLIDASFPLEAPWMSSLDSPSPISAEHYSRMEQMGLGTSQNSAPAFLDSPLRYNPPMDLALWPNWVLDDGQREAMELLPPPSLHMPTLARSPSMHMHYPSGSPTPFQGSLLAPDLRSLASNNFQVLNSMIQAHNDTSVQGSFILEHALNLLDLKSQNA
jgi:hypothetical protein